jgi:hypothetical protein
MNETKRREIVESLEILFFRINPESPKEDLLFLMDNCYYEINIEMLKAIIPEEKFDLEKFNSKNYSYLRGSSLHSILNYIEENINTYVERILLEIKDNTSEDIESYILLLNNSDLELELKEKLIQKTGTVINDINTVNGIEESHLLFKNSKVAPTWENIQCVFSKDNDNLTESTILFLNNEDNATELSKRSMPTDTNKDGIEIYDKLCNAIIHGKYIKDNSYELLLCSIPWCYATFDYKLISKERMKVLIEKNIVNTVIEGYNFLLQNFKGLNVQLIEKDPDKFIEHLDQIELDLPDMELLLRSSKISKEIKFKFINSVEETVIGNSDNNARFVLDNILLDPNKYSVSDSLKYNLIVMKELSKTERIKLFIQIQDLLDNEKTETFLISLGNPYEEIPNHKKTPLINRDELNENLMDILKQKGIIVNYSDRNNRVYHSIKKAD